MKRFATEDYIAHLSIDCVIFGYEDQQLKVLICKFKFGQDLWGLPGGFIRRTESTDQAANRILQERTNLDQIYLEQFRVFGDENRIVGSDFRAIIQAGLTQFDAEQFDQEVVDWIGSRFVGIGYYALVDIDKVHPQTGALEASLDWKNIHELPALIHDHNEIVIYGLKALRENFDRKLIGFNLLPDAFTMKQLKELYEAVYDTSFRMNNFQKKILALGVLERLGKQYSGGQHRAPYVYRFKRQV